MKYRSKTDQNQYHQQSGYWIKWTSQNLKKKMMLTPIKTKYELAKKYARKTKEGRLEEY
jgi:hypothetical protein